MKDNYSHETFAPGFDPYGNNTKIEREEDLEVNGVNLVGSKLTDKHGSNEVSLKPIAAESIDAEEADDETYALPADKGVVVQVISDDQMPTDVADVPAEMLIAPRRLGCPNADFDMDILYSFPPHAVIPVYAKPKARINRQRQGYSRRKAKRAYQARAAHQVKLTRYKRRGRGYMLLVDENGNPVNLKSDVNIKQTMGRAEVGSYMQPTKPSALRGALADMHMASVADSLEKIGGKS